jgi:hypothetical protein
VHWNGSPAAAEASSRAANAAASMAAARATGQLHILTAIPGQRD